MTWRNHCVLTRCNWRETLSHERHSALTTRVARTQNPTPLGHAGSRRIDNFFQGDGKQ